MFVYDIARYDGPNTPKTQFEELQFLKELGFKVNKYATLAKNIDEVIKNCSLDNMVVETDCPYLTPTPEGDKRNEPMFIKHTLQKIADLKGVAFDQVCEKTTQNARKLFGI